MFRVRTAPTSLRFQPKNHPPQQLGRPFLYRSQRSLNLQRKRIGRYLPTFVANSSRSLLHSEIARLRKGQTCCEQPHKRTQQHFRRYQHMADPATERRLKNIKRQTKPHYSLVHKTHQNLRHKFLQLHKNPRTRCARTIDPPRQLPFIQGIYFCIQGYLRKYDRK